MEKSNLFYEVTKVYYKLCKNYFRARKVRLTVSLVVVTSHLKIIFASGTVIDNLKAVIGQKDRRLAAHMHRISQNPIS